VAGHGGADGAGVGGAEAAGVGLPGALVDAEWLAARLGRPGLVVADVRWNPPRGAREAYERGHIPGAIPLDVDTDLAGPARGEGGRHPLPEPEAFAATMARAGIGDGTVVVAYDDARGSFAARLWWMLSVTGHPVAVLDGGLQAWPGPVETGPPVRAPAPATFTPRSWPAERLVDADEVDRLRADPSALVLDVRAADRYRGDVEPIDRVAGHIPGARNAPWTGNVDPGSGRFLPPEELRRRHRGLGADRAGEVVVHCGSGVTACHTILAAAIAGVPSPRLYVGSWSGWTAGHGRPVATGED
jgi:thiosulfate/3-mercaptopyruvate sulfurtransferase